MEKVMEILKIALEIFGALAVIVKLTPTLKDDNIILPIIKFLGKLTNYQEPEKK